MPRYILEIECKVRVLNDDHVEVGSSKIEGSVAVASGGKMLHSIIDSTTLEFSDDMARHAKRIFQQDNAPQ